MNRPVVLATLLGIVVFNAGCATEPSIIPLPQQLSVESGTFTIDSSTRIVASSENPELVSAAEYFSALIKQSSGIELPIALLPVHEDPVTTISLVLADQGFGDEGY